MAERVFSIDFGSAFTKVALRRDPTADAVLVLVEQEFFVPTVVAADRRGSEPRIVIGEDAAGIKPGGGISVFTNFKQELLPFHPPADTESYLPPLDALLQSDEFGTLAGKYAVTPQQVAALRQLAASARTLFSGPTQNHASLAAQRQENAFRIAYHFFRGLRQQILRACAKLSSTGLKFEDIPVRISVPAFPSGTDFTAHPGCKLLCDALQRAGWPLHPELPLVMEPESNAVGILTKAANTLKRGRINMGEMFNKGPLITVLKGDPNHPSYRALVMDVGAYTTDFASVYVDTGGKNVSPDSGAGFTVQQRSIAIGVRDLESSLLAALPKEKQEWLGGASSKDYSAVLRNIYDEGKGFRVPGSGGMVIGGEADRDVTQACLSDFAQRVANEVSTFCEHLAPASMQELILTGGGSNIPAVRDVLIKAATANGLSYVKAHAPGLKKNKAVTPLVDNLDELFARGGSALGGASIYFEKSYYES